MLISYFFKLEFFSNVNNVNNHNNNNYDNNNNVSMIGELENERLLTFFFFYTEVRVRVASVYSAYKIVMNS